MISNPALYHPKFLARELFHVGISTERRLQEARLGHYRAMADFDWQWPQEIDRPAIEELLTCAFVERHRNAIICGPQGIGKTMLTRNIGHSAVMVGHTVLFTAASKLVIDLSSQESAAALQRRLRYYERPHLLLIDEVGYLSFDHKAADFIFEIINRRYEHGSIVITTNLAFKDWHKIFPGAPCITAMIDRLTHLAEIVKISGDSFRVKESTAKKAVKPSINSPNRKAKK